MAQPLSATVEMVELYCGECGIKFMVPDYWVKARSRDNENNGSFYCPNGHARRFSEPYVTILQSELERQIKLTEFARNEAKAERTRREKLEKRTRVGLCPFCKRTFQQLARHMKCKHSAAKEAKNNE